MNINIRKMRSNYVYLVFEQQKNRQKIKSRSKQGSKHRHLEKQGRCKCSSQKFMKSHSLSKKKEGNVGLGREQQKAQQQISSRIRMLELENNILKKENEILTEYYYLNKQEKKSKAPERKPHIQRHTRQQRDWRSMDKQKIQLAPTEPSDFYKINKKMILTFGNNGKKERPN